MTRSFSLSTARGVLDLAARTHIMGIVNVTPDSFSDGGRLGSAEAAVAEALEQVRQGADIIDVGGESTRPTAEAVPEAEELDRVLPVIAGLRAAGCEAIVSVDTTKAAVARQAIAAGADLVNDISAMRFDPDMPAACAEMGCPVILMHIRGRPAEMQARARYGDVVTEVVAELASAVEEAVAAGVRREAILIDPGIGFAKTAAHNLALLNRLDALAALACPVVVGASRKSFLGEVLGLPADQRLEGTLAITALAVARGAHVIRVHDVEPNVRAARVADAVVSSRVES